MVKVFLKGGVWKNSEDEILKAAIQKYGKNQWARVASLLNRKTAKQAKARWYEWLDPAIRKTEWSRAEEEKLLHLAKLMPAQWKSIAPLVGRTATQCQEHYEYLLDQAAGGTGGEDDLRKQTLKPGQIDSHPEAKPARPDPIDMDEDELEMLQEARARLANTQGKKAKRKQREKLLAQAKRLADLQKRRELKQAGLLSKAAIKKSRKGRKEIDLGVEIPFHKPAPAGFHDTSGEDARAEAIHQKRLKSIDYQKINENQYRTRDREAAQAKKREEQRLKILEESNEKYAKQREEEMPARPRGTLSLPAPTITDIELAKMAKLQHTRMEDYNGDGQSVTKALLGDYSDEPIPTPMRTPATSTHADIMREASHLRRLESGRTPLLMGAEEEEEKVIEGRNTHSAANSTPRLPDRAGAGRTPRDQLGLNRNTDDALSVGASTFASSRYSIRELARQERRATKRAREELEAALASLPAPQFEYELAIPVDVTDDDAMQVETIYEQDQADIEAAEQQRHRREAEKFYEARSSVLKREDLPRPAKINTSSFVLDTPNKALALVHQEMLALLKHDAHAYPVAPIEKIELTKKKKSRDNEIIQDVSPEVVLDEIPENTLNEAKALVSNELSSIYRDQIQSVMNKQKVSDQDGAEALIKQACCHVSANEQNSTVYTKVGWQDSKEAVLESLRLEFDTLQKAVGALQKKNDKIESKLSVVTGGYNKRATKLNEEVLESFSTLQNARIEEYVYNELYKQELQGGANRIEALQNDIMTLKKIEGSLQKEYGDLVIEKRRLLVNSKTS